MFVNLFVAFLVLVVAADYVFLPAASRRAWQALAVILAVVASMLFFTGHWQRLAEFMGVGRAVDMLIYVATTVLAREMFLSRARFRTSERNLTDLVRALAIRDARRLPDSLPKAAPGA